MWKSAFRQDCFFRSIIGWGEICECKLSHIFTWHCFFPLVQWTELSNHTSLPGNALVHVSLREEHGAEERLLLQSFSSNLKRHRSAKHLADSREAAVLINWRCSWLRTQMMKLFIHVLNWLGPREPVPQWHLHWAQIRRRSLKSVSRLSFPIRELYRNHKLLWMKGSQLSEY